MSLIKPASVNKVVYEESDYLYHDKFGKVRENSENPEGGFPLLSPTLLCLVGLIFIDGLDYGLLYPVSSLYQSLGFNIKESAQLSSIGEGTICLTVLIWLKLYTVFPIFKLIFITTFFYGVCSIGLACSSTYWAIFFYRLVLGCFTSSLSIGLRYIVGVVYDDKKRGKVYSFLFVWFYIGTTISSWMLLSGSVSSFGETGLPIWRIVYFCIGLICIGYGILIHFVKFETPAVPKLVGFRRTLKSMAIPSVKLILVHIGAHSVAIYAALYWGCLYLTSYKNSPLAIGMAICSYFGGCAFGCLVAGVLNNSLEKYFPKKGRIYFATLGNIANIGIIISQYTIFGLHQIENPHDGIETSIQAACYFAFGFCGSFGKPLVSSILPNLLGQSYKLVYFESYREILISISGALFGYIIPAYTLHGLGYTTGENANLDINYYWLAVVIPSVTLPSLIVSALALGYLSITYERDTVSDQQDE